MQTIHCFNHRIIFLIYLALVFVLKNDLLFFACAKQSRCEGPHKMRNKINRELVGKNGNKWAEKSTTTRLDVISSLFCR
ncbi:hypothetical protein JP30_09415 [Gallibacterium anatis IPDH697-78]|nr:hypothetical protein JP30_09415 [Gallibacterium anatis IPDH697-78]